jgi:hypothetical protein
MEEQNSPNTLTTTDVLSSLKGALSTLRAVKPEDRSGIDRRYAIVITELEKVFAYFYTYIYSQEISK